MRIIVDYKDSDSGVNHLKIDSAKYLSDYAIRIRFSDGKERLVDFKPFLSKSLHPSIKKYLDEKYNKSMNNVYLPNVAEDKLKLYINNNIKKMNYNIFYILTNNFQQILKIIPMKQHQIAKITELANGEMKSYEVDDNQVLLVRQNDQFYALSGTCPHYGAPLAQGVLHDHRIICPWHHACFNAKSGKLEEPPALDDLRSYELQATGDDIFITFPDDGSAPETPEMVKKDTSADQRKFVIIGAGAAGYVAAQTLREDGYKGEITLITKEERPPYDRPNLSKAYMQGEAPSEWMPLRTDDFYDKYGIDFMFNKLVTDLDVNEKTITLSDAEKIRYDKVLIATGGIPRQLNIPGKDLKNIFTLRSYANADAIIAAADKASKVAVIGSSFIGMEVAYSLSQRKLPVTVISPDEVPFQKAFGREIGELFKAQHEKNGTNFRLKRKAKKFEGNEKVTGVILDNDEKVDADLVVVGIGVDPSTDFVKGIAIQEDFSLKVDQYFSCGPDIYAAGDIASFTDWRTGALTRIEHWRTALQQGRIAAHNMAGKATPYNSTPFFWTRQAGLGLTYVGFATEWDEIIYEGEVESQDFLAYFVKGDQLLAITGIGRPQEMDTVHELMNAGKLPEVKEIRNKKVNWIELVKNK